MKFHSGIRTAVILFTGTLFLAGCGANKSSTYDPGKILNKQVHVGDIDISYRDYGSGYPLIMLMGLSGTMDTWDPNFINELSKNNRIIMLDYRGFGRTDIGNKQITIKQYAEDAAGLMEILNITRANLLGWSMGTYVAQEFALSYPHKTRKIVLYAADFGGKKALLPSQEVLEAMSDRSGSAEEQQQKTLATLFPVDWLKDPKNQEYLKKAFGKYRDKPTDEGVEKQWNAWMSWQGTYDRLPGLKNKTLLISGTSDINTPWQNTQLMFERIPNAWMTLIKDGGHGVMFQQPTQMADLINGFLK